MVHQGISKEKLKVFSLFQSVYSHIQTMINWTQTRVTQNAPTCLFPSDIVHVAFSIPQEPPKKLRFQGIFVEWPALCLFTKEILKNTVILVPFAAIYPWLYGQMVKIWSYGHIIIQLYGVKDGQIGFFLLQKQQ